MESVQYFVEWHENAGRVELFARALYWIPLAAALVPMVLLACYVLVPLTFLHILLTSRRNGLFSEFMANPFFLHKFNSLSYMLLLSDEQPGFLPRQLAGVKVITPIKLDSSFFELFVRIAYAIPLGFFILLLGILSFACVALQFLCVLILGRRNRKLWDIPLMFARYLFDSEAYLLLLTDERPPVFPTY